MSNGSCFIQWPDSFWGEVDFYIYITLVDYDFSFLSSASSSPHPFHLDPPPFCPARKNKEETGPWWSMVVHSCTWKLEAE